MVSFVSYGDTVPVVVAWVSPTLVFPYARACFDSGGSPRSGIPMFVAVKTSQILFGVRFLYGAVASVGVWLGTHNFVDFI